MDPATTLHDVRWGEDYDGQFVWVFEISGSVPADARPDAVVRLERITKRCYWLEGRRVRRRVIRVAGRPESERREELDRRTRSLRSYERFEPYGPFVLMAVIFIPGLSNWIPPYFLG